MLNFVISETSGMITSSLPLFYRGGCIYTTSS